MVYPSRPRWRSRTIAVLLLAWMAATSSQAGVVVVANRTRQPVEFELLGAEGGPARHRLAPGEVLPIPAQDVVRVALHSGARTHESVLLADSIYYFVAGDEGVRLGKVALPTASADGRLPAPTDREPPKMSEWTVQVMLLVDDDEPGVERLWQQRLRRRVEAASQILQRHCRVRLEIEGFGTWDSDDRAVDFAESLREFELEVDPGPNRVAIGFTSQYRRPQVRRVDLGGTRGPLHPHILIREWAQHVSEMERLEALVHELGHFLGATHSPEGNSAMRPTLGDRRANARGYRIGFDPINTFITYRLAEEIRAGRYRGFHRLDTYTKAQLRSAYLAIAKLMPEDEATGHYLRLLDARP